MWSIVCAILHATKLLLAMPLMMMLWLEESYGAVVVGWIAAAGDYGRRLYRFSDQPPRCECPHCALNGNDAKKVLRKKDCRMEEKKDKNGS